LFTHLRKFAVLVACAAAVLQAYAQPSAYPNRPIHIVVSNTPGTVPDALARAMADRLAVSLGQPVVVENKPGAEGIVAGEAVARSAPDGYTLFLTSSSVLTANQFLKKRMPYTLNDFTPITKLGVYTFVVAAHPSVPAKTLQELFTYGRANPNKLSYATGTVTSIVAGRQLAALGNMSMLQVPYKSDSAALPDVISGRVQLLVTGGGVSPLVKEGKLRALAVLGSKRSTQFPGIPTFAEQGLSFPITLSAVLFGPAKIPKDIVSRLHREITAILDRPELRDQFEQRSFAIETSTPEELAGFMLIQRDAWGRAIREAGIEPE
jgi:tripartite-type tricarboxylate transporter receptor subunit TctC